MSSLDYVNIEEKTVNVAVFNQTDAALAELKIRFSTVPDCSTKEGYAVAKAGKNELTKYRSSLENARKDIKSPYKTAGEIIDSVARRIKLELEAIEAPIKAAIKDADEAEARKKAERIARLQSKVDEIYLIETKAQDTEGKEAVSKLIESLNALDVDNDFYDLTKDAQNAKATVLDRLGNLYAQRLNMEVAEGQRLEAEERSKVAVQETKVLREKLAAIELAAQPKVEEIEAPAAEVKQENAPIEKQQIAPTHKTMISIPLEELNRLNASDSLLFALKTVGVEQWAGWEMAIKIMKTGVEAA